MGISRGEGYRGFTRATIAVSHAPPNKGINVLTTPQAKAVGTTQSQEDQHQLAFGLET